MADDPRKELLRQMREIRESLDPEVLERARLAAFGKVPYDRDVARQAVGRFLDTRDDGGAFRRKLEEALRREGRPVDLDAEAPRPDARPDATVHPLKPRRIGRIA